MKPNLLSYIKLLSQKDKKTLSQKALKTSEEVGELAKKILPFDNASGSIHKFTDKQNILEEVADVILSSLSIAYDLGFDDDDIESMIHKKSIYWNELQNKESLVNTSEIPFEIHVTVETEDIEGFKRSCECLGVKPIVIELENSKEKSIQVMTSSDIVSSNTGAYNECKKISDFLKNSGFNVVREKIESVPWHPAAPSDKLGRTGMPKGSYFETHFTIVCDESRRKFLELVLNKWECHLSRNVFKKMDNGQFKIMGTFRNYTWSQEKFKVHTKLIKKELKEHKFDVDKVINEFCIYDTKESKDWNWMENEVVD
jgi:NTP pyrophosphatase (non-canonical NTP hydrolase)